MKSGPAIIQGYNATAMVDAQRQVIVHAQACGQGDDGTVAEPMLAGARQHLQTAGLGARVLERVEVSADTGYFSNRNLEAFAAAKVDACVPDPKFRQRDPRLAATAVPPTGTSNNTAASAAGPARRILNTNRQPSD